MFLAGEAHLALLSAQWGMGMREKGAKNGLLWELKSFILWSWTVLSFWISFSLPFSTIVDCKTACCSAVPPNQIEAVATSADKSGQFALIEVRGERRFATFCNHWYFSHFLQLIQYELREVSFRIFFGFFLWFAAFISEFTWTHRVLGYETLLGFQKIVPCYVASYLYIFNRGQKSDIVCSPQRYEMQMYRLHYLKR